MTPAERELMMLLTVSVMKTADRETRHMLAEQLGALYREDAARAAEERRSDAEGKR